MLTLGRRALHRLPSPLAPSAAPAAAAYIPRTSSFLASPAIHGRREKHTQRAYDVLQELLIPHPPTLTPTPAPAPPRPAVSPVSPASYATATPVSPVSRAQAAIHAALSSPSQLKQTAYNTPQPRHMSAAFTPRPLYAPDGPMVWIDLEMTGLDYHTDTILEVAVLITNGNLDVVDDGGFRHAVKTDKKVLDNMNDWCIEQHGKSGLTAECLSAPHRLREVTALALAYVRHWVPERCTAVLAGSSIHVDRAFMAELMPDLERWMHYRIVDVSSVKELCRRWYPELSKSAGLDVKNSNHRALDDIRGSISELRFYREHIFKDPEDVRL
ncbi:ribonuclease H-like protein [Calocera viscosa TUFC12733]|uniref:Ribonuclease H-like protein n=1 Tax=Calocera viscosa (strain TUFC12733) TaxID=1330018 RepID=A0A167GAM8_CALVF|nr:ribonuclease H-like protein [Calocera viscosa TUFC12733]